MKATVLNAQVSETAAPEGFMPHTHAPLTNQPSEHERGFADKFGLHPGIVVLTGTLDVMLFGGQLASAEFLYPLAVACAFGLGIVTYLVQRKYYGDDNEAAFIKAFIVAGLTAIPTSLPGFLTVPAGVLGFFRSKES